ncbi:MAG TPA: universal stress protein [Lacipirellulaceae bacterium]|nr:universal stress protein [Lacipirellulaceae bacterium]
MQRILVATDFSETAAAALAHAAKLATFTGGAITLLHVIYAEKINETLLGLDALEYLARAADEPERQPGGAYERLREAARQKLREAVAALPQPHPAVETVLAEGRPSTEITAFAAANGIDHIVVGTHGRSRLGKAFLGSVADNVIRQADVPVTIVR